MNYIKLFEDYHKENEDSTIIYRDDKLVVVVPTTYDATKKYSRDTDWCSNQKSAFEKHDITGNLFRFHFKDGYKLRLTWDYLSWKNHKDGYGGGTHWGCGGLRDGKRIPYYHIRPVNENDPFYFNYDKDDHRTEMVNYIEKIPQKAIDLVTKYQNDNKNKFNKIYTQLCNDINQIKIVNIEFEGDFSPITMKVTIQYKGREYNVRGYYYKDSNLYDVNVYGLPEDIDIPYIKSDFSPFKKYMFDKLKEYSKKSKILEALNLPNEINKIKLEYKQKIENCLVPLSDMYEMSYRDRMLDGKVSDNTYRYSFKVYNTTLNEFLESLDRSLDRLNHELDATVQLWASLFSIGKDGDRDTMCIGTYREIIRKGNNTPYERIFGDIEKYGITKYYLKLDLYIS